MDTIQMDQEKEEVPTWFFNWFWDQEGIKPPEVSCECSTFCYCIESIAYKGYLKGIEAREIEEYDVALD